MTGTDVHSNTFSLEQRKALSGKNQDKEKETERGKFDMNKVKKYEIRKRYKKHIPNVRKMVI